MNRKFVTWAIPSAVVLAIAATGCNPTVATTTPAPTVEKTTTATAKRQDVTGYGYFSGKLVIPATAQADAYSPFDTPVESVSTELGKYVDRGASIIKLTIPGADDATNTAKSDVETAKAAYSQQKANISQPVRDAQQALDDARAAEKAARETVANGGSADVDAATQTRVQAEDNLKQAEAQRDQTLQPTKTVLVQTAAELAAVKADARKGIVRAPISGTVVSLDAKPGMTAQANQTLATIINFEATRVQGTVPPEFKDFLSEGKHVIIAMGGDSSAPVDGTVMSLSVAPPAQGQSSPGYVAVIRFDNPREMPQPSTAVKRIGVKTGSVQNALVVPVGAIQSVNGKSTVKVQSGSSWVDTPVQTGLSDGVVTEIKSGLAEGAVVQVPAQPLSS